MRLRFWAWSGGLGAVATLFFFFNDTATTEIYTLSLHDALPISANHDGVQVTATVDWDAACEALRVEQLEQRRDRKSTRLNSSHSQISYAVFCLQKKSRPTPPPAERRPS